jgi:AraC-like DNA-binding protein
LHRYLNDLRVRDLLGNTEKSITDNALMCGFVQPSHFATVFRKRIGISLRARRVARRLVARGPSNKRGNAKVVRNLREIEWPILPIF